MQRYKALLHNRHVLIGVCVCVGLLSVTAFRSIAATHKRDTPLVILQQSGVVLAHSGIGMIDAIFTSLSDDQTVYLANNVTNEGLETYSERTRKFAPLLTTASEPISASPAGYAVYQDTDLKIITADPTGKLSVPFPAYPAYSLAVLSNGNIVVASPVGANFIHIYSPTGQLLKSFGKIQDYAMPEVDELQTLFLRRGKVLIDATDNIYYVFQYVPLIQKYSPAGKLLLERQVQGEAIDMQQAVAQRFLRNKAPGAAGGINIINSAKIDHQTGHLWLCMNGSTATGVVYEYSALGDKIREYALEIGAPLRRLIGAKDIALTTSNLYVLTLEGLVVSFNRDVSTWKWDSDNATLLDAGACGTEQTWPICPYNCPGPACSGGQPTPTSSNSSSLECKAPLMATLVPGYKVMAANCKNYMPGSPANPGAGIPAHLRGACEDNVTVCYDGQNSTHSLFIDCPPPPANACSGGGGGGGGCLLSRMRVLNEDPCLCGYNPLTCQCYNTGDCSSPILIDIRGNGFDLTDAPGGVNFGLKPDGVAERIAWTSAGSDDAFLVLDRNHNHTIDDGTELFGNFTPQPFTGEPNGFIALAEYDKAANGGNNDGRISNQDAIFASLRLWQDANHNGISEASEIHTLSARGVYAIRLNYQDSRRKDGHGNLFRFRARVLDSHGTHVGQWAWDVFFTHN